jgi:hypothetical protein
MTTLFVCSFLGKELGLFSRTHPGFFGQRTNRTGSAVNRQVAQ